MVVNNSVSIPNPEVEVQVLDNVPKTIFVLPATIQKILERYAIEQEQEFIIQFLGNFGYITESINGRVAPLGIYWQASVQGKPIHLGIDQVQLNYGDGPVQFNFATYVRPFARSSALNASARKSIGTISLQIEEGDARNIPLHEGDTVIDVLETASKSSRLTFSLKFCGKQEAYRVNAINGLAEIPRLSVWVLLEDGSPIGSLSYKPRSGDKLKFIQRWFGKK